MTKITQLLTAVGIFLLSTAALAQNTLSGIVVDASSKETLPGASVSVVGTSIGTITDLDGKFSLNLKSSEVKILVSFVGYTDKEISFTLDGNTSAGSIELESNSVGIEEIVIIASVVKDRQTPVAVSTIDPLLILEKLGTKEFPEILKSTPSVYATKSSGGFGDSRITLRGFDSNNIGVLINGIPVNDMESGKVYWSNWAGLSDVTSSKQVQRGLGASKLALSSVGGTINIITKSTDVKQGGSVYVGYGNDGMRKESFTTSTGMLSNGWAVTLSGAHTKGDGYIDATSFEGWSYFVNISKVLNEKHKLSFTAFGAPQWHNQRYYKQTIPAYQASAAGSKSNLDWGYKNGEKYNAAYNYYHKPQISLNHYWNISETSKLATSAYASVSSGGGRRVFGAAQLTNAQGLIDWDAMILRNQQSANGSVSVMANSINSHNWYGALSTYTKELDNLVITGGFDGRFYQGIHAYEIEDLLGGKYFLNTNNKNAPVGTTYTKGDYVNYHNIGEVLWAGLFGQVEYSVEQFSAFVSSSVANNSYRRIDYFAYLPGEQITDWSQFWTTTYKGGVNYNISANHNIFANGGYISRAPYFRNSYIGNTNVANPDAKNEKILTYELGYGFQSKTFNAKLNVYRTSWKDKGLVRTIGDVVANIPGINALHQGVELEMKYKPSKKLTVTGMFSLGDWTWTDDIVFDAYNLDNELQGTFKAYMAGAKVGNAAQLTGYLGIDYEILPKFKLGGDFNYWGKNYAEFDPTTRTNEAASGIQSWQLPDSWELNMNANYHFKMAGLDATVYGNVDNILNTEYIIDGDDGSAHDINTSRVFYAFGRTWSVALRIKF